MAVLSKIGIGPMSSEIIEAVFRFSEKENKSMMLIASKNQIDWDGGYVNDWDTKQYMDYIKQLKSRYPQAKVYICRDHCGPGFKKDDLEDVYKTIDSDIDNGFDLIHVDFCYHSYSHQKILEASKEAIDYIKKKNNKVLVEVGTDENLGEFLTDITRIEADMKFFSQFPKVIFYVCQTGSLIRNINQVGSFNVEFIKQVKQLADQYNLGLKEHNADYLNKKEINLRRGLIDAVNVAPQYGVLQTKLTIERCLLYGIDFKKFLDVSYKSKKWEKWLHKEAPENKFLCALIAGHYNFATPAYQKIYQQINEHEDLKEEIINMMMKNFKMYSDNL